MFMTPIDTMELWKHYYAYLPAILVFYSDLLNSIVFGLFKDEVNMDLFFPEIFILMCTSLQRNRQNTINMRLF